MGRCPGCTYTPAGGPTGTPVCTANTTASPTPHGVAPVFLFLLSMSFKIFIFEIKFSSPNKDFNVDTDFDVKNLPF